MAGIKKITLVKRKACWWAHWPLKILGLIPGLGKGNFQCLNMLSFMSFAGIGWKQYVFLQIRTLTGGPLCRESHTLYRSKNSIVSNWLFAGLHPATLRVQCTSSIIFNELKEASIQQNQKRPLTWNQCTILWIGMLTWGPLCRESHLLCRLKDSMVIQKGYL